MAVEPLTPPLASALRAERLTYCEVGGTAGKLPQGYRTINRTARLSVDFEQAARDLFRWQVHLRAGVRVAASDDCVVPQAVVVLGLGVGPLSVRAPCRVVYVIDEPGRRGFAYGTLPGHVESGEEAFVLSRHADGTTTFTITAFSRPARALTRWARPAGRLVQDVVTARYLRAFDGPR